MRRTRKLSTISTNKYRGIAMIEIEHLDYHEDKVINGILHYRDGASWKEYSKQELTEKYLEEQELFLKSVEENYELRGEW
jgi:hypothetical protein